MKVSFLILLLLPLFAIAEEQVPPNWTYTTEQQEVITKYGNPHLFAIVQLPEGPTRYETWYYFGLVRKQFGFSNGKKVRELPLGILLSLPPARVAPRQFTFNTTRANLGAILGPPTSVLQGLVKGLNEQNLSYSTKGVSVTLRKGKVVSIATLPAVQ